MSQPLLASLVSVPSESSSTRCSPEYFCLYADYKVQPTPQQYALELRRQAAEAAQARKERQRVEQEEEKLVGECSMVACASLYAFS